MDVPDHHEDRHRADKVAQFLAFTGTSDGDAARAALAKASGDVRMAVDRFFEAGGSVVQESCTELLSSDDAAAVSTHSGPQVAAAAASVGHTVRDELSTPAAGATISSERDESVAMPAGWFQPASAWKFAQITGSYLDKSFWSSYLRWTQQGETIPEIAAAQGVGVNGSSKAAIKPATVASHLLKAMTDLGKPLDLQKL
eukprot:COSAG02_NODE_20884_length_811_cov_14.717697_1_plen_198_part_10